MVTGYRGTSSDPVSAPPRWATVAAHVAALTPLPAALWRFALVFGYRAGYTEQGFDALNVRGWGVLSLIMLSALTETAALLTLGLVQRWGEIVPRWIPFIGGRAVHLKAVVISAAVGATILIALWTQLLLWWNVAHAGMTATGATVVGVFYLPLVAWGPLLAAVTVSYHRRHRSA